MLLSCALIILFVFRIAERVGSQHALCRKQGKHPGLIHLKGTQSITPQSRSILGSLTVLILLEESSNRKKHNHYHLWAALLPFSADDHEIIYARTTAPPPSSPQALWHSEHPQILLRKHAKSCAPCPRCPLLIIERFPGSEWYNTKLIHRVFSCFFRLALQLWSLLNRNVDQILLTSSQLSAVCKFFHPSQITLWL